jgi:hypothetical protein
MRSHGVFFSLTLVGAASLHAQGLPTLPHTIPGICPLECCRLGRWQSNWAAIPVYVAPGQRGSRHTAIAAKSTFVADSSIVVVRRLGIAIVDRPVRTIPGAVTDSTMLAPGDTVYLLHYQLEDTFTAVVNGVTKDVEAFWKDGPGMLRPKGTPFFGRALRGPVEEWWVHVRFGAGSVGWINMTRNESVSGPDGCGGDAVQPRVAAGAVRASI